MTPIPNNNPITLFLDRINPEVETPKETPQDQRNNNIVFSSILSRDMSQERVDMMLTSTVDMINQHELALGRSVTARGGSGFDNSGDNNLQWWQSTSLADEQTSGVNPSRTFMGRRQLFEMTYHNQISWRSHVYGGLFAESNRTLPVARRVTRQLAARAITNFFSVEPWVKAVATNKPDGSSSKIDNELATAGERFFNFKSGEAKLKNTLERALERACVVGECILKTRHTTKFNYYKTSMTVLVNAEGKFILGADGDYIVEDRDTFAPKDKEVLDEVTGEPMVGEDGLAVVEPDTEGGLFLERDGETLMPEGARWEWREGLVRRFTEYSGPVTEIVATQDFMCPQTEEDIQKAPMITQITSVSPFDIVAAFGGDELAKITDPGEKVATTAKYIQLLSDMNSDGANGKIAADMARPELGESGLISNIRVSGDSRSEICEVYRTYDADGDGSPEEIFMVIDRKRNKIIYCDYLQNVTEDGLRPFTVLTVNRVAGRWHGVGIIEQLEPLQNNIDYFLNRSIFSSSSSGTSVFFNPEGVTEGDAFAAGGMDLPFNSGTTWHLKKGWKAEDVLKYITIPEVKMGEFGEFLNLFQQASVLETGLTGANDATAANIATSETATGIRDITAKGNEMAKLIFSHLDTGVLEVVQKFAIVLFRNMSEVEAYEWSEKDTRLTGILKRTDANRIKFFFEITLTGSKNEQAQTAMTIALPAVQQWSMQSSLMMEAQRPMLENYLKAMQIQSASEVLLAMVAAKKQEESLAAQAAAAQQPASGRILN